MCSFHEMMQLNWLEYHLYDINARYAINSCGSNKNKNTLPNSLQFTCLSANQCILPVQMTYYLPFIIKNWSQDKKYICYYQRNNINDTQKGINTSQQIQ